MREAERVYEDTRTAAERYSAELADLNELHRLGYIDADTFGRAVEKLNEDFQKADFEPLKQGIEDVSSAIADAIVNGEDLGDAIGGVLKRIAADILASQINNLLQGLFAPLTGGTGGDRGQATGAKGNTNAGAADRGR